MLEASKGSPSSAEAGGPNGVSGNGQPPTNAAGPAKGVQSAPSRRFEDKEVFPTPSTIQKKDLLHQKLTQKEQDLRQAQDKLRAADRQIKGLNTQLSDVKKSRREIQAELDDLKEKLAAAPPSASGESSVTSAPSAPSSVRAQDNAPADVPAVEGSRRDLGDEHEALAARLLESGLKLDSATLAAAAAGLKDTSILEKQLKRAREDGARLQGEIQQLNDTVFSKSFKPPSAWADREVKYKAEKRDWEQKVANLKEQIKRLTAENQAYRDNNKAAEFEAQIKKLNTSLEEANAEKVAAQQSLHELELKMREMKARRLSPRESRGPENASVLKKILTMEDKSQGAQKQRAGSGMLPERRGSTSLASIASISNDSSSPSAERAGRADLQDIIDEYDDQGIQMSRPLRKKRSKREKPEAFKREAADASASESAGYDSSVDVEAVKQDLKSRAGNGARSKLKPPSSEALNLPLEAGQPEEAATERTKDKQGAQPSSGGHLAEESREVGATLNQQVPLQDGGARQGDNSSAVQEPERVEGASVIERAVDLAGSTPVMPTTGPTKQSPVHSRSSTPGGIADARHDDAAENSAEDVIASDTVRHVALGIGEDELAPLPQQAQRAQDTQLPTDSASPSATAEVPSVLPSDTRDHSSVSAAVRAADKENDHIVFNGISEHQIPGQKSIEPKDTVQTVNHIVEEPSSARVHEGRNESEAGVSSRNTVDAPAEPATAGILDPEVAGRIQSDSQEKVQEVLQSDAGPLSPTSPFAADTGHLTVDGEDPEAPQLKGAAAAVAHARRKSLGEELPEPSGLYEQQTSSVEQGPDRLRVATSPNSRRTDILDAASRKFLARESSEEDSPWTREDSNALQVERNAVEEKLLEHLAGQDVNKLKWRAALMESRVEMHAAQITKMQKALEEADQEKARVEQDLEVALRAMQSFKSIDPSDQQNLQAIRERIREENIQSAESAKMTHEALQQSYREVQELQKHRDILQKQLGDIAAKIDSGMIPDPEDLELPALQSEGSQGKKAASGPGAITAKRSLRHFNSFIEGLSEGEIEIMNLRQENENVMDTLVRTKVELAETQGDYLKMRRALIRAVEKQAAVTDRLESIKYAIGENDIAAVKALVQENLKQIKQLGGDIESLGERDLF